ncbi:hypothetical protein [Allomesorhizobium alhagi]|uniref:Uncharacterized protein n=1 Tax=Mesorhizobium alhagi CCNWXJ12-2 TaxID=1107882 RepID=H0HUD9_9HYPH|nr:hypothetical protein [Mesorhizobium alhagi]EHK55669.1 hypothetical protein MAXJ12_18903 [Mesorhizobium alhagi CCNWXJ12-2]
MFDRAASAAWQVGVKRSEDLTPHCLTLNVTDRFAVPNGMQRLPSWLGDDGWQVGSAWQHGRNWLKRLSSAIHQAAGPTSSGYWMSLSRSPAITPKHAIRVLGGHKTKPPSERRHTARYGAQVREALVVLLWEASDRLCSKRLKPLIPVLLPALARHGQLDVDGELRDKLLTISAATMDRLLSQMRVVARGGQRRRAGMSSAVRRSIPVRTFGDWNDPPPGYVEVDFVAHSGTSSSGSFARFDQRGNSEHALDIGGTIAEPPGAETETTQDVLSRLILATETAQKAIALQVTARRRQRLSRLKALAAEKTERDPQTAANPETSSIEGGSCRRPCWTGQCPPRIQGHFRT